MNEWPDENWMSSRRFPVPGHNLWATPSGRILNGDGTECRSYRMDTGYKYLSINGVQVGAHVLACSAFHGPRPNGCVTRHLNGVRDDNRIGNLVWGTQSENILDSVLHGTHANAAKTECPQGHPYSLENTHVYKNGHRRCRACHRERARARRQSKKACI